MKPHTNPPGTLFNFDAIPLWICSDLWDEKKHIRYRGLLFVLLYILSFSVFGAIFLFVGALIFSKPLISTVWVWLFLSVPGGLIIGIGAWWDFARRRRKLLLEDKSQ